MWVDRYFTSMQKSINLNDRRGTLKNMALFYQGYNHKTHTYVFFLHISHMNIKLFIVRFGLNWLWSVDVCVGVCGGGDEG